MSLLISTIIAAIVAFAATNIDDIFLISLYFTQVNASFKVRHIIIGQYVGFAAILAVSALGFFGALVIPESIIGLLGFAPIYMGIRQLIKGREEDDDDIPQTATQSTGRLARFFNPHISSVALVMFANGGDNISIYIPMFAGKTIPEIGVIIVVFALCLGLLCFLGYRFGNHPALKRIIERFGHIIIPFVLIGLGLYILVESGTWDAILGMMRRGGL